MAKEFRAPEYPQCCLERLWALGGHIPLAIWALHPLERARPNADSLDISSVPRTRDLAARV